LIRCSTWNAIDVEEIATALADQTDSEHRWLIDLRTGEMAFWTCDTAVDGENPVELDKLDLILIDPLPPNVWYQGIADFADGISDRAAGEALHRALQGKVAFRRFNTGSTSAIPTWSPLGTALGMSGQGAEP
jgi:hypothetical protein